MIAPDRKHDTAPDRVAGALSSEAARTELYRYASSVAKTEFADRPAGTRNDDFDVASQMA